MIEIGPSLDRRSLKVFISSMIGSMVGVRLLHLRHDCCHLVWKSILHGDVPIIGTLASIPTLAIGFLMRSLGGWLSGHFGGRVGREPVLLWSLPAMAPATVIIGMLPTYGILLGYNGASVVAGLLPIAVTLVFSFVGWIGPAVVFSAFGLMLAECTFAMRETAPRVTGRL